MTFRPYYLMVTFWGEKFREYFYSMCLRSLLSPNNLPRLKDAPGSKFVFCTTSEDWAGLEGRPLFERMRQYVEPVFIDIGYPDPKLGPHLHMSKGHRLAARMAVNDRAWAGFVAPDLLISDGMIPFVLEKAQSGKKAVLAPALRYAMEPVMSALADAGLLRKEAPLTLTSRQLAAIAQDALHSEIARYDFESPYFGDYPIWCYWRVKGENAFVLHTVSWALLLGDYGTLHDYKDSFLHTDTIDGFYVFNNFYKGGRADELYFSMDSDEVFFMSTTPEAELTYLPMPERPINQSAGGARNRYVDIHRFVYSSVIDDFRRVAYRKPYIVHGSALTARVIDAAAASQAIVDRAMRSSPAEWMTQKVIAFATRQDVRESGGITAYPAAFGDLIQVCARVGIAALMMFPRRTGLRLWRAAEAFVLRLLLGRLVRPVLGRLDRRQLARVLRALPRRYRRPVLERVRSDRIARDRDPLLKLWRMTERFVLRLLLGRVVRPVLGRLNRRRLARVLRAIPKRYRRPVLTRVRSAWVARDRDPLFHLQRRILRLLFGGLVGPAVGRLNRRQLAALLRKLPHHYRRPVLSRARRTQGSRVGLHHSRVRPRPSPTPEPDGPVGTVSGSTATDKILS